MRVPWNDIPDYSLLPHGLYQLIISELLPYNKEENNKLIVKGTFEVVEPEAFAGQTFREWFTCGNDDDPEAEDPDTWKKTPGARKLKRILSKAKAELMEDLDETCSAASGAEFCATVEVEVQQPASPEDSVRRNNRIREVYEVGQATPQILDPALSKPAKPAAPTRPTRPAAPVQKASAPAPSRPQRPVRMIDPPAPAEVEQLEDPEEEEATPPPKRVMGRPPVAGRARR